MGDHESRYPTQYGRLPAVAAPSSPTVGAEPAPLSCTAAGALAPFGYPTAADVALHRDRTNTANARVSALAAEVAELRRAVNDVRARLQAAGIIA